MYKKDFPIFANQTPPYVYLDSAATTHKPQVLIERMSEFMSSEYGTVRRGLYNLAQTSTNAFDQVRKQIQAFIGAKSSNEIIFTRGTTESINLVASCFAEALHPRISSWNTGTAETSLLQTQEKEISFLISGLEHHANWVPWQMQAQKIGAKFLVIPVLDSGDLDLEAYEKQLQSNPVKLVALTQISNSIGTVNPIKQMIELAHQHGALVLIDGAQGIAHSTINVQELDCDFYVFSAHKLYGPTGLGILYGKEQYLEALPPYHGGGEMIEKVTIEKTTYANLPFKFEAGTPPIIEVIGFGASLSYLENISMPQIIQHENQLHQYLKTQLKTLDGIRILGNPQHKAGLCSFVFDDIGSYDIGTLLNEYGIAIRTGHHCAQPVMSRFGIDSSSRISIGLYNDKEDIDLCIEALGKTIKLFRN